MQIATSILSQHDLWIHLHAFTWAPWQWSWDIECTTIATDASVNDGWGAEWQDLFANDTWSTD